MASENKNNGDGIRRYLDQINDIEETANRALQIATANALSADTSVILDISQGGTGSAEKIFVDTFSDQFEIDGLKIFRNSIGFQHPSDVVDSGELAGNIRLISCDEPAKDVGPQMRFSGRSSGPTDKSAFAFATIAGRKENSDIDNKAGYIQFATTDEFGIISEFARGDSEGNLLIGTGEVPLGMGNRLWVSGGDVFLDAEGGNREYRVQAAETFGRMQSMVAFSSDTSEHTFLSQNVQFSETGLCALDSVTGNGAAAIELRVDGGSTDPGGTVRFYTSVEGCPSLRGLFSDDGLEVFGNAVASNNIIAGGINNAAGGPGNCTAIVDGFVTGDNIKYGPGSPEGAICGPIGAIYGRNSGDAVGSDPPDENTTLWVKVFNDGEPTGWLPIQAGGEDSFCAQTDCPEIPSTDVDNSGVPACRVWFDTSRSIMWYYDPDVIRSLDPLRVGAWLSIDIFQITSPVTGRRHSQQFRGNIDKDYEYFTPIHMHRQQTNMFLLDLTAAVRVARNSSNAEYSNNNYYTFDLVTLERRQGDPSANRSTRQEWPGDREPYETRRDNLRADGHTFYPNLSDDLVRLSSFTPDGPPADGTGSVTAVGATRRVLKDSSKSWADGQWKERNNNDLSGNFPANNGYAVRMLSGTHAGISRTIRTNSSDTLTLVRPWPRLADANKPAVGDLYEIVDNQHRKVIARISTRGNVFPDGAHVDPTQDRSSDPPPLFSEYALDDAGNTLTRAQVVNSGRFVSRDVQDFVTTVTNGLDPNNPGGLDDNGEIDPSTQHIKLDHYINIISSDSTEDETADAVVLAGLWDSVRRPGKISGVISVTFRMALPPDACTTLDPESV